MATPIKSGSTSDLLFVNPEKQAFVKLANPLETDGTEQPNMVGSARMVSAVDDGLLTGIADLKSPETDDDYRLRIAHDTLLDIDEFDYAAQNTGKHTFTFTTLAATMTSAGITTNSSQVNTTNIGLTFGTHAFFPYFGTNTLVAETSLGFTNQPAANIVFDFGLFLRGSTPLFAPSDGAYFRLTSAGLFGVCNFNGVENITPVFHLGDGAGTWVYANNAVNRYLIQITNTRVTFWVNNEKLGELATPVGQNGPFQSAALPWSFRHANTGTTGDTTFRSIVKDYKIGLRGPLYADALGVIGNRVLGSYQGISGGTMGQLIAGTVTSGTLVKPTAAIPANTSLVANLPNSLGGRIYEQLTAGLAANVDGIFASFTNPAGSATVQGKRLKITGIMLSGMVSTVVVGGPAFTEWYIAFGHTADSLATAESASMASATTKAPRRFMLPKLTTNMGAAAAAGTLLVQPEYETIFLDAPIYINPGERVALVGNKTITTAITSGILSYTYQFIYSWE
jgi:hypothetical protein